MTITVQIPTALRRHTAGTGQITCSAKDISELFSVLDQQFPDLKPHLRDEAGQIRHRDYAGYDCDFHDARAHKQHVQTDSLIAIRC